MEITLLQCPQRDAPFQFNSKSPYFSAMENKWGNNKNKTWYINALQMTERWLQMAIDITKYCLQMTIWSALFEGLELKQSLYVRGDFFKSKSI